MIYKKKITATIDWMINEYRLIEASFNIMKQIQKLCVSLSYRSDTKKCRLTTSQYSQELQSRESNPGSSNPGSSNQACFLLNPLNNHAIVYLLLFLIFFLKKSCRNSHGFSMNPYKPFEGIYSQILVLRIHGSYPTVFQVKHPIYLYMTW